MTNTLLLEDEIPAEDVFQVGVGVKVDGLSPDSPLCKELGLLLVAQGEEESVVQSIREVVGLPKEFQVRVELLEPTIGDQKPIVIDPSDFLDLTIRAQDCVECSAYSWAKGCSSWPW